MEARKIRLRLYQCHAKDCPSGVCLLQYGALIRQVGVYTSVPETHGMVLKDLKVHGLLPSL